MCLRHRIASLASVTLILSGCATTYSTFTNLTPRAQPRNESGSYIVEFAWDSRQTALRRDSVRPSVQVGTNYYAMKRLAQLSNRWETLIPVTPGTNYVNYRFRVDYLYNSIPVPREDSRFSALYQLQVIDAPAPADTPAVPPGSKQ
ncbi:MAG: hypothetical protein FJ386_14230 [Verrucomicrobia bacterium]|nr:hypothetical protein [Verrucomicrobiota bacterium]